MHLFQLGCWCFVKYEANKTFNRSSASLETIWRQVVFYYETLQNNAEHNKTAYHYKGLWEDYHGSSSRAFWRRRWSWRHVPFTIVTMVRVARTGSLISTWLFLRFCWNKCLLMPYISDIVWFPWVCCSEQLLGLLTSKSSFYRLWDFNCFLPTKLSIFSP